MKVVMKFPAPHNVGTTEYRVVYEYVLDLIDSFGPDVDHDVVVSSLRELARTADDMADTVEHAPDNLTLTTAE